MKIQNGPAALAFIALVFFSGCGIDNGLQTAPSESTASYTILVNVQPPLSLRTEDTRDNWMTPVEAVFHTDFITSADEGDGHVGHTHKPVDHPPSELFIGRVETGGYGIAVRVDQADTTWTVGHNGPEIHLPIEGTTHHLRVFLEDAIGGRAVPGYSNIPGAGLHLNVTGNGTAEDVVLLPVQGPRGFRYEANATIPLGIYDMRIHVSPPTFYRSVEAKDRWMETFEASLPAYDVSNGSGNASIESHGMRITVRAGAPKAYGLSYDVFGIGRLPVGLQGDETVNFSARLEDPVSPAEGVGQRIANSRVEVTVVHDESGISSGRILYPTYGARGFCYAANLTLPRGMIEAGTSGTDAGNGDHAHDDHSH